MYAKHKQIELKTQEEFGDWAEQQFDSLPGINSCSVMKAFTTEHDSSVWFEMSLLVE